MLSVRRPDFARMVTHKVERMEKARNVRGLLRLVRQRGETDQGELLGAIQALARLRDPRAALPLHTAYEQAGACASIPMALAYGTALAAVGDLYAVRPLAQALALQLSRPELVAGQERELEQAVCALRSLGSTAFDAIAPTLSRWGVPRHYRAPGHFQAAAGEDSQTAAPLRPNHSRWSKPATGASSSASHVWLTADSAYLIAGASGDARAIDVLTPALIDHFSCAIGAAGAALGLGWLGATQAVEALIASLLMGVVLERFNWLRGTWTPPGIAPLIDALWHDLDAELYLWHHNVRDAHGATAALRTVSLATVAALGRLRCQQAAVPLLLATLSRAQQESCASDGFARVMSTSLSRTGGLPSVHAVADGLQTGFTFSLDLQCRRALRHFGVELPAHDPLYAPRDSATSAPAGAARWVFALFPTRELRVLVRFATNQHLRQLVREELAWRRTHATE